MLLNLALILLFHDLIDGENRMVLILILIITPYAYQN